MYAENAYTEHFVSDMRPEPLELSLYIIFIWATSLWTIQYTPPNSWYFTHYVVRSKKWFDKQMLPFGK